MSGVDVAVNVAFRARDGLSRALDRIADRAQKVRVRMQKFFSKLDKMAAKSKSIMGGFLGGMLISQGLFALSMGLRRVVEEFVGMDQAVTSAAAKFPELISRGTKAFEQLETAARNVGKATEFTAKDAAEGLEFLAMAGFNSSQAMSVLPLVVDLATGANMGLARATDIASDALGAFNMQTQDSVKLTENLGQINDVFARTVTSSNVTLEHMFQSMKDGGPTMTTAGQSIETFAAIIGTMGNAGIKGGKAGTSLKTMAIRLAAPVGKAGTMLKKLGISVADSSGNMRDMLDILDDLNAATKDMGSQQRLATIDTIFGKRAVAGINVVLSTGIDKVRAFRHELEAAKGSAAEMAEEMRKGIGVRLDVLKSSLIEAGFKFLETFQEKFPNALDDAIDAVQRFDFRPILEGLGNLIDLGKKAYNFFVEWKPWIIGIAGAFVGLKVALMATSVALAIVNILALLNPFVILAMGIGAAIALLWYYWDDVQKWTEDVLEIMLGVSDEVNLAFVNMAIGIGNAFLTMWSTVARLLTNGVRNVVKFMGSVSATFGMDVDTKGALEAVDRFGKLSSGMLQQRKLMTFDDVRQSRQKMMGIPTSTLAERAQQRRDEEGNVATEGFGTGQRATMLKAVLDPNTLKNFTSNQTTDIRVDVGLKDLMAQFDQMVTVDASAFSSEGTTNTTVNRKRAGAN